MRVPTFYFLLVILLMKTAASQDDEISRWISRLRTLLKGCPPTPWTNSDEQDFLPLLRYCLQHRAIVAVDSLLMDDVIPILDGINLVRYEDRPYNTTGKEFDRNHTNDMRGHDSPKIDKGWQAVVMNRLTRLFRTHVLKIDLDQVSRTTGLSTGNSGEEEEEEEEEVEDGENLVHGRRRRHKRKSMMVPMMMMGFLFMGTILIPMGFQFLAVLGGKALVLAKMALVLSSIQGLKKIATSGVNYGLYHSPASHGWNERSHQETKPPNELQYRTDPRGQSTT